MRINVYNYTTKELINSISIPNFKGKEDFFHARILMSGLQAEKDFLNIGKNTRVKDFGFNSYYSTGVMSNTVSHGSYETGDGHFVIGDKEPEPNFVELWNEDGTTEVLPLKLAFFFYPEGWQLKTGKTAANIFGGLFDAYLANIGTRNVTSKSKAHAKIFAAEKALLSYIQKHRDDMEYLVKNHGYNWELEATCPQFETEYYASLSEKKKTSAEKLKQEILMLLDSINCSGEDEEDDGYDRSQPIPQNITDADIEDEILYRMKKLNLWNEVIKNYLKSGEIYMSETGGIIYKLNEEAKKAVEDAQKNGLVPYHVVRTLTSFGELYAVLYVSRRSDDWAYERGNKEGWLDNYCYNSTYDFAERGESKFVSCHGGLQRVE